VERSECCRLLGLCHAHRLLRQHDSASPNLLDPASQLPPLVQATLRRKPFERARDRVEAVLATVDEKAM